MIFDRLTVRLLSSGLISCAVAITGCGIGNHANPPLVAIPALHGRIMGGQQPLAGSTVKLYAVGVLGNGSAATDILGTGSNGSATFVISGSDGSFTITGDYTCPALAPATPVYLTATGGNPGLTPAANNSSIALVAALGPCDTLLSNASTTYINISEATTAAAAWALAPFATSLTDIGATPTNLAGITHAFAIANQLVDISDSSSPSTSIIDYAIMETAKLYSLADILASCVNTNGTDGNCASLFNYAHPTSKDAPTNTFAAALNIVQNPANNVALLYGLIPSSPPYPGLATAPNDWTMTITFNTFNGPFSNFSLRAFDAEGNFWGLTGSNLTELNRQYAPMVNVALQPYTDGNDYYPTAVTIDGSQNVWISAGTSANVGGTALKFDATGNQLSPSPGYADGGIIDPVTIAADSNGLIWIGSSGVYNSNGNTVRSGGDVTVLDGNGTALSPSGGFANFSDFCPGVIAFDSNNTAWFSNNLANCSPTGVDPTSPYIVSVTAPSIANPAPNVTKTNIPNPFSPTIAVDTNNDVWFTSGAGQTNSGFNQLGVINGSGTLVTSTLLGGGLINGTNMMIDPANNIWIANVDLSQETPTSTVLANPLTISQFSAVPASFGAALSPTQGYGTDPNVCSSATSTYVLIDASGSLWVDAGSTVIQEGYTFCVGGITTFVGLATPTKTPNTGPPQAP